MKKNKGQFTAIYKKSGKWYIGWIEELPGVNTQGKTLMEVKENIKDALSLVIETNKIMNNKRVAGEKVIREKIVLPV